MFWRRRKLNSLSLAGDGDDLAILEDVQRVFGIGILDSEAARVCTVGQLYDLIVQKLPRNSFGPDYCLSAHVFYRLRAAVDGIKERRKAKPATPLSDIIGRTPVRRFWRKLERETGLKLPELTFGPLGFAALLIGGLFLVGGLVLTVVQSDPALLSLLPVSVVLFWLALHVLPAALPPEAATLGGLSRGVMHENFRVLADAKGTCRPIDVWNTLEYLIRKEVGDDVHVDRHTVFFDEDYR